MYLFTILPEHVGQASVTARGRAWWMPTVLGSILPGDVGKRVHVHNGVLSVENDEQRDRRVKAEKGTR